MFPALIPRLSLTLSNFDHLITWEDTINFNIKSYFANTHYFIGKFAKNDSKLDFEYKSVPQINQLQK